MNLKGAAFLALIGMVLLTLVAAVDFVNTLEGVMRDLLPALAVIRSLIYLFACITLSVFLFVFHRTQQR